jgi:hypothetical protein
MQVGHSAVPLNNRDGIAIDHFHAAIAEAAVVIDRERRMIGHLVVEIEPAEPPISELQLHFLAQPPFKAVP